MTESPGFEVESKVIDLLAAQLGADASKVAVVAEHSVRTPDGSLLRKVFAAVEGESNQTTSAVFDAVGSVVDLPKLEVSVGRRLFSSSTLSGVDLSTLVPTGGLFGGPGGLTAGGLGGHGGLGGVIPVRPPIIRPERVTIEPRVNDLTLSECAELDERITVTVPASGASPKADVYLLADTTGSMSPIIDAVKAGALAVVGNPALAGFDVAYGVGNYRDFPVPTPNSYAFLAQQQPTTVLADVQNALNVWTAAEGGDGAEGQLWALQQIATDPAIGWRPDAKRIVVWFGDAPGHDPVCATLSGGAADVTEATATAALVAANITVVAVSTNTGFAGGLDADPNPISSDYGACTPAGVAGQATRITAATPGGSLTTSVDATAIVATLASLIATAVTSTGNVSLVPTGDTAVFVESISPAGGFGPLAGDVAHVLPFDVHWHGSVECSDEAQVFYGTIDVVADGVVVASKRVRVTVPPCLWHHPIEMLCGINSARPIEDESGDKTSGRTYGCTVAPGRYATAVTIYNPGPCPVTIEKRFAPLLLNGKAVGREPKVVPAKPFAKIVLQAGEATMDDCCALGEAVRLSGSVPTLGILDIVSDHPLVVTGVYTSNSAGGDSGASVHTRTVTPSKH